MNGQSLKEESLIQNLKDAGCSGTLIDKFMNYYKLKSFSHQKRILAAHRGALLDKIHKNQRKLDCLDYLVYRLKQNYSDKGNI